MSAAWLGTFALANSNIERAILLVHASCPDGESSWAIPARGARRGSKGSSKGKGKARAGHESEIVSRLSTLLHLHGSETPSTGRQVVLRVRYQRRKPEERSAHATYGVEGVRESTQRGARSRQNETPEESRPWWRFPLGGCESSLRASTKRGGGTDEPGGTASHIVSRQSLLTQRFSVQDQGIPSQRRTGHGCGPS